MDDPAFRRLLLEENADLYLGYKFFDVARWDRKRWSIGYGTPSYEGEVVCEPLARQRAWVKFHEAKIQAARLLSPLAWQRLSEERKGVLFRMVYQLGYEGVKSFRKMLSALEEGDYGRAADEMLNSKWAREDSPLRAMREATIMRNGT